MKSEDIIVYSIFGIIATVVAYGYAVNLIPRKGKCLSYDSVWSVNDSTQCDSNTVAFK